MNAHTEIVEPESLQHPEAEPESLRRPVVAQRPSAPADPDETAVHAETPVFTVRDLDVHYGANPALKNVTMNIRPRRITAIIGPSGCGKSTLIRCFNRMNELIPGARVSGEVLYHGENIYDPAVDP